MEGVENFKYLGRPLEQTYDEWLAVIWNVNRLQRVWGRLGNILRREGANPKVAGIFYRAVTQVVILFVKRLIYPLNQHHVMLV